jgi:hypothetical protein
MNFISILYFAMSLLVGLLAIGRRGGFVLYFLASILLTPILVLLFLVLTTRKPKSDFS